MDKNFDYIHLLIKDKRIYLALKKMNLDKMYNDEETSLIMIVESMLTNALQDKGYL